MSDLSRDQIDAKIFLLRQKHKDPITGRTDMGQDTPYDKDFTLWLEEKGAKETFRGMSRKYTKNYIDRMHPSNDPDQLPMYEPQALLAVSTDECINIAESEATLVDLRDHRDVRQEVKRRHDMAHAKWDRFIQSKMALFQDTTETWAQMEARMADGDHGHAEAAD